MTDYIEITLFKKTLRFYSEERIEIEAYNIKDNWKPIAIRLRPDGYRSIPVYFNKKQKQFRLHRVVYFAYNPEWDIYDSSQNNTIDHQDQNKNNNHISNLKIATAQQQQCNKNCKGVSWNKALQKWCAQIRFNGVLKHLGLFVEYQDAIDAYQKAKLERDNIVWNRE